MAGSSAFCTTYIRCFPFLLSLYSFGSMELPATTVGEGVETPLPVKTQGRTMDRSLAFNDYAVCRVAFNPSGRDLGSDGRRPQNRTARTADAPQRQVLSERAAGGEGGDLSTVSGPRGRGARWLTEHAAHPDAATREPTRGCLCDVSLPGCSMDDGWKPHGPEPTKRRDRGREQEGCCVGANPTLLRTPAPDGTGQDAGVGGPLSTWTGSFASDSR